MLTIGICKAIHLSLIIILLNIWDGLEVFRDCRCGVFDV